MTETKRRVRRLADMREACKYGGFGRSFAYRLIADGKIDAYKMEGKTMIDLNTVDAYHESLEKIALKRAS